MASDSRIQGRHKVGMNKRTIAILGMGQSSTERRWDIERYVSNCDEVWGLNNGYLNFSHCLPMFTRWYELHSWAYLKKWSEEKSGARATGAADHFAALNNIGAEVICTDPLPGVAKQTRIDWVKTFRDLWDVDGAGIGANYFLGSPSLMLAHAMWEHDQGHVIDFVQTYGIDTNDPTHRQQRASWAYWCSQAHARNIEMKGTALDFMAEPERDGGLVGLREAIGDRMVKVRVAAGHRDFVLATHYTDDEKFRGHAERLQKQADALGIKLHARNLGKVANYGAGVELAYRSVTETVTEALDKHEKAVIWMDCDDQLLAAPTLPHDFDGFGYIDNPEMQFYGNRARPVGSFFAVTPTQHGRRAIEFMQPVEAMTSHHRAVCALVGACEGWRTVTVKNITDHFRGCFEIVPNLHRTQTCYT